MPNLNKVMLIGHITKDIELKYTNSDLAIANFSIAINTRRKNKDDEVYFANIVAFDEQAKALEMYVGKGDPIYIEGRLTRDEWEDNDGNRRTRDKIILSNFQFIGSKKDRTEGKPVRQSETEKVETEDDSQPF